ncbi:MAG TPA: ESPR domain-containing protein, partial [Burkholderiaceae bacterium]|nr:ESPR domain-containing protein [Burkholderiaceae bacterium]
MNRIFQTVWNAVRGAYVVASELVGSKEGKGSCVDETARPKLPGMRRAATASAALLVCAVSQLDAATLYWDVNGTAAGLGGTGTWNTSNTNWNDSTGTAAPRSWNNTTPDDAVFGGTGATVTVGSGITFGTMTFNTANYVLGSGSLNLGTA